MRVTDHWIKRPEGRLFARAWQPDAAPAPATILLIHDSLGCVALWRDFPERLAQATGHRVVAYDRLGFGRSGPRSGPLTLDFMRAEAIDSVPALAAQLGLGALIPFGHSVGGAMAVATAARAPKRCVAVITVAAQAFLEKLTHDSIAAARETFRKPAELARLARPHGDNARWVLDAWTETWLDPAFAGWTLDADLSAVRCPLLALHGDRDEYGTRVHPDRIARLSGGTSVMIEDCGHVPQRERPEVVLREVCGFLASLGPPQAR